VVEKKIQGNFKNVDARKTLRELQKRRCQKRLMKNGWSGRSGQKATESHTLVCVYLGRCS